VSISLTHQVEQFGCIDHRGYVITANFEAEGGFAAWSGDGGNFWFSGDTAEDVVQQIDTAIEEA
jgi:predicted RNase H-like HicB family nuclease